MPIEYYYNMRANFCRQTINEKNISFSVGITRNFGQLAVVEALCGGSLGQKIIIFIEIVNCGQTYCLLGAGPGYIMMIEYNTWNMERWEHRPHLYHWDRTNTQTGTGLSLCNSPTIQPTDIIKLCYIHVKQLVIWHFKNSQERSPGRALYLMSWLWKI